MLAGRDWFGHPGATPQAIAALRETAPIPLPAAYLALLAFSNGGEGALPVLPLNFCLYRAEDAAQFERDGAYHEFFPGLFVIGSNGGGEAIAIDTADPGRRIVYFDMVNSDLEESVVALAANFDAFLQLVGME